MCSSTCAYLFGVSRPKFTKSCMAFQASLLLSTGRVPLPQLVEELAGQVVLNSSDATVLGQNLRYKPNPKKLCLGFWSNTNDRALWQFTIAEPGLYVWSLVKAAAKAMAAALLICLSVSNVWSSLSKTLGSFRISKLAIWAPLP